LTDLHRAGKSSKEGSAASSHHSVTTIAFIVNGSYESAMGFRARDLAARLHQYNICVAYRSRRKILSIFGLFAFLTYRRPAATYVFDISYSGVLSAVAYRILSGNRLLVETGDAIVELARSNGSRGRVGLWLTRLLEDTAFRSADRVVVRGSFHKEWLSSRGIDAEVIQDGVDTDRFTSEAVGDLRKQHGLDGVLTVGLVGSSIWSEKLQMCYGWELVELLRLLKDKPVKGVMVGNGSGIPHLKARCREYGIEDRIVFIDYVPYEYLPRYLSLIDVCLSTQTNDLVGQVRTTGKLPVYLAAGRYVLASNVGEAARVLDKEMLVDYDGVKDPNYPRKLVERIQNILENPETLTRGNEQIALAKTTFDYSVLSDRLHQCLERTLASGPNNK
jgi:glycosyltransferase involved in cell wall biosynthesis